MHDSILFSNIAFYILEFYKDMVSFSNYIENVYEWINAGCCQETIKMTNEFNYKLIVAINKYLSYSFLKLNDLPSLTNLKLEIFFINNFDGLIISKRKK